jgi:3-dehydroquinate synthase
MSVVIDNISVSLPAFLLTSSYSKILVIADEHTKKHCYPKIKRLLPKHHLVTIRSGEENKTLETCQHLWLEMTRLKLDRHALVVNLGGGVIGDMGGFCAATYKRGIDFIQIPTTLLAQVDASVGGKLGVDFFGYKNHIGVFTLPSAVFIDVSFLDTLPERQLRSGFAEVIKHCLIQDHAVWMEIKTKDLQEQDLQKLIEHSVNIKKKVVAEDPTEKGLRKILNFGHTLGHAIETYFLDKGKHRLLHGEAIAAGMVIEAYLAFTKKMITEAELIEIEEFIFSVYGKVNISHTSFDQIIALTLQDKKNKGNQIKASLLTKLGACGFDISISKSEMVKGLGYYAG